MKRLLLIALVAFGVRGEEKPIHLIGKVVQTWPERGIVSLQCVQGPRESIQFGNAQTAEQMNAIIESEESFWRSRNSEVDGFVILSGLTNIATLAMQDRVDVTALRAGVIQMTNANETASVMALRLYEVVPPPTNTPPAQSNAVAIISKPKREPYKPAPLLPLKTRTTKPKGR